MNGQAAQFLGYYAVFVTQLPSVPQPQFFALDGDDDIEIEHSAQWNVQPVDGMEVLDWPCDNAACSASGGGDAHAPAAEPLRGRSAFQGKLRRWAASMEASQAQSSQLNPGPSPVTP